MIPLDEAIRRTGEIHNAYAGRRADDPIGVMVARIMVDNLARDGFVLVPREATPEMKRLIYGSTGTWADVLAAAPKVGGSK